MHEQIPTRAANVTQVIGLKIALCGVALISIAVAIASQPQVESPTNRSAQNVPEFVFLVPCIVGALLTFLGAVRISLTGRPWHLAAFGTVLLVAASVLPGAASRLFSEPLVAHRWTSPLVLPFFVLRVDGLILFSTAFVRLLIKERSRS